MTRLGRLLTGIALLLVVCGCGAATTAPDMPGDGGAPPADTTASQSPPPDGTQGGLGGILGPLRGLLTQMVNLVGDVGASVEEGRWSLDVPAGAIQGDARIAIGVAYPQCGECTMEVVPATQNKFDVLATVTVDCSSLSDRQLAQSVIYEFDPVTRRWFEVPGSSVDLSNRSVSAPVDHAARYSVGPTGGKAGW